MVSAAPASGADSSGGSYGKQNFRAFNNEGLLE